MTVKILLIDLETAPSLGYVWEKYQTNVIEFENSFYILSVAWKWLGDQETQVRGLCDYSGYKKDLENDYRLVKDLWTLLDEADIVIAQNGDAFDVKKANARFVIHNMLPPSSYKTVDTLKIARKYFKFESNSLADLAQFLRVGEKMPNLGFRSWKGCMEGDEKSWEIMKAYNARDVDLLELLYLRLRPWAGTHPDLTVYTGENGCPTCTSTKIQRRGFQVFRTQRKQRFHCTNCGAWFAGKLADGP